MPHNARTFCGYHWKWQLLLIMLISLCMASTSSSNDTSKQKKIEQIKVAYLANFILFTTWPEYKAASDKSPLVICLVDTSDFASLLTSAFPNGRFNNLSIIVHTISELQFDKKQLVEAQKKLLLSSHIIYLRNNSLAELVAMKQLQNTKDYLLVGDMTDFAQNGGMIGFRETNSGVRFDVNANIIRQSNVQVSSKILRLGTPVRSQE